MKTFPKMHTVHIANTFFEEEIEADKPLNLYERFHRHSIFLQLQFLPFLYANPEEGILLSDTPPAEYLQHRNPYYLINSPPAPGTRIETWGPSKCVAAWAAEHQLIYHMPSWDLVKTFNSKEFSFKASPQLPHATLLFDEASAHQWMLSFPGNKVLKSCFGLSGTGHLLISQDTPAERISTFIRKEFNKGLPLIAEPWVERVLDFSTQWEILPAGAIQYIGATLCKNDEKGQYQVSIVGDETILFADHLSHLESHKQAALGLLTQMATHGYFGNVGFDAMIYNSEVLHPIVEINARKTMGWAALKFQQRHFPQQNISFSYVRTNEIGLLPRSLTNKKGQVISFSRNLVIL